MSSSSPARRRGRNGDYRLAALDWESAYAIAAHGGTAYNAGRAWERVGDRARAADAYAVALEGDLLPAARKDATERVAALEPTLGIIIIDAKAGARVTLDGEASRLSPHRRHVVPGSHDVRIERDGAPAYRRAVDVAAGATVSVSAPEPVLTPPNSTTPASDSSRTSIGPIETTPRTASATRTAGFVAFGASGLALATGFIVGALGSSANDRFNESGHLDESARDQAVLFRTTANVAFVGAAVFAVTGLVLLLVSPSASASSSSMARTR